MQLTPGGIILDSVYYTYDNLHHIPSIYIPPKNLVLPNTKDNNNRPGEPAAQCVEEFTDRDRVCEPQITGPLNRGGPLQTIAPCPKSPTVTNIVWDDSANPPSPTTPRTKKKQKMRRTPSGLVYSGTTAILSHLYKARFVIDNIPYNSVEQRLQSQKAVLAKDDQAVNDIMALHDTWEIKLRGDRVKVTKESLDKRLPIAEGANAAKFHQNPDLMEFLVDTGDVNLIEGASSSFWGGGEHYNSIAYDNQDAHGKNYQGVVVMRIRRNELVRRQKFTT